jgi:hypothetical protein
VADAPKLAATVVGSAFDTNSIEQAHVAALWRWPGIGSMGDMTQEQIPQANMPMGQRRMFGVRPMSQTNLTVDPTYRTGYRNTPTDHSDPQYGNIAINVGVTVLVVVLAVAFLKNFEK